MNHTIRRVKSSDWIKIKKLRLEMINRNPDFFNVNKDSWKKKSDSYWQNFVKISSESNKECVIVAVDSSDIIAMAHVEIDNESANFGMLYVKSEYRNLGIAHDLTIAREKWSSSVGAMNAYCLITIGNMQSEKLHKKMGWNKTEIQIKDNDIVESVWSKSI